MGRDGGNGGYARVMVVIRHACRSVSTESTSFVSVCDFPGLWKTDGNLVSLKFFDGDVVIALVFNALSKTEAATSQYRLFERQKVSKIQNLLLGHGGVEYEMMHGVFIDKSLSIRVDQSFGPKSWVDNQCCGGV